MDNKGSKNAKFLRLYTNIQTKLYAFVLSIIHNRNDADELVQETAVVLWEKFDQFQEGTNFSAWAIGIAKNKVLEHLRKNKKTKMVLGDQFYLEIAEISSLDQDDITNRVDALKNCLQKISSSDQQLIQMRYRNKQSVKNLSQITGRSANSLYKSLARILYSLRLCINRTIALQDMK